MCGLPGLLSLRIEKGHIIAARVSRACYRSIVGRGFAREYWYEGMLRVRARLCRACVRGDCGWSMLGSPISGPVEMRCDYCDRRLLRSELMSYARCSRSVIRRHRVAVSVVSLLGMYVMCDRESRKRGRDRRVRSRWYVCFAV